MASKKNATRTGTTAKTHAEKARIAQERKAAKRDATSAEEVATSAPVLAETEVLATETHEAPEPATVAEKAQGMTLAQLSEAYIEALATKGKGLGTRMSYLLDLSVALKILGEDTLVDALTEAQVTEFFESAKVTKTRTGSPKAQVSIDKTRRVFRQAMEYAVERGLIAHSPVAKVYATRKGKESA